MAAPAFVSVTQYAVVNASTVTVAKPSGVTSGTMLLLAAFTGNSALYSLAGWQQALLDQSNGSVQVLWKIAGSSEPSQYVFTVTGATGQINALTGVLFAYSGASGIDVAADTSSSLYGNNTYVSFNCPSVTATQNTETLLCIASASDAGSLSIAGGLTSRVTFGSAAIAAGDVAVNAGPTGAYTATALLVGYSYNAGVSLVLRGNAPPAAPTLTSPASGSSLDTAAGFSLTAGYNSTDQQPMNAYALRLKPSGGSYSYWNASTSSMQSTIVWNPLTVPVGGSWTVNLPSTVAPDGSTYNWSMASQESAADLQGVFASDSTFNAVVGPTLVVNGPTGTVVVPNPVVNWTTTPGSGLSQTAYRVVCYNSSQYGASGFTPGEGASDYDSGTVTSSAQAATVAGLLNNTYRAYVQVTETGGVTSLWEYTQFTVHFDQPATPTISAAAGTYNSPAGGAYPGGGTYPAGTTPLPSVNVTVQGHDNLLPVDDGSFEGSIGTWASVANATLAQSSAWALDGTYSLAMTAVAAADMEADCASLTVTPGFTYTALASLHAAASARSVTLGVVWRNSGGATISTSTSSGTDSTSGVLALSLTAVAPAGAVHAVITITITAPAASEVHYVDEVGLFPGTVTGWTRGGLAGTTEASITYTASDGTTQPVRGTPVALPAPDQTVTVSDLELVPGQARTYTAQVTAPAFGTTIMSNTAQATGTAGSVDGWVLAACTADPVGAVFAAVGFDFDQAERASANYGLGAVYPVIISDVVGGHDGTVQAQLFDDPTFLILAGLLTSQSTVWLSNPFGDGWYVRAGLAPGSSASVSSSGGGGSPLPSKKGSLDPQTGAARVRSLSIQFVEQPRPS